MVTSESGTSVDPFKDTLMLGATYPVAEEELRSLNSAWTLRAQVSHVTTPVVPPPSEPVSVEPVVPSVVLVLPVVESLVDPPVVELVVAVPVVPPVVAPVVLPVVRPVVAPVVPRPVLEPVVVPVVLLRPVLAPVTPLPVVPVVAAEVVLLPVVEDVEVSLEVDPLEPSLLDPLPVVREPVPPEPVVLVRLPASNLVPSVVEGSSTSPWAQAKGRPTVPRATASHAARPCMKRSIPKAIQVSHEKSEGRLLPS
jgi:hypothetical protein